MSAPSALYLALHSIGQSCEVLPAGISMTPSRFDTLCRLCSMAEAMERRVGSETTERIITFDDGYADNLEKAAPILERHGMKAIFFVSTERIGSWFMSPGGTRIPTLSRTMIRNLSEAGHEIGSHGHEHRFLTKLSSMELAFQLRRSRGILEDIIGGAVRFISYPFGQFDSRVTRIARDSGFISGFSVNRRDSGPAGVFPDHGMTIERAAISGSDSLLRTIVKVSGHFGRIRDIHDFMKNMMSLRVSSKDVRGT